mgnify:CR=1 FL=1
MIRNINNSNTVSSHFLTVIKKGLKSQGIDTRQLFNKAGIVDENTAAKIVRVKQQDIDTILNESVRITEDDAFSVKLINHTAPASNLLTVLAGYCDSLRMLFNLTSQRYGETYTNSIYATLDETTHVRLIFETSVNKEQYPLYTIDFILVYVVKFFSNLLDDPLATPIVVKLKRQKPRNLEAFKKYFCCPLEFNAIQNEICFDKRIYNLKNPLSNKTLASATKLIMEDQLKSVTQIPLSKRTISYINNQLPEFIPKQEEWATCLNISVRNLQRQLKTENTSFNEILKHERVRMAKTFLKDQVYSIAEISSQLHFSDSSHFIKTFKQKTGITPKAYQTQNPPELRNKNLP